MKTTHFGDHFAGRPRLLSDRWSVGSGTGTSRPSTKGGISRRLTAGPDARQCHLGVSRESNALSSGRGTSRRSMSPHEQGWGGQGYRQGHKSGSGGNFQSTFSSKAIALAKNRLPRIQLFDETCFELEVKSIQLVQEIARGAYGVVHTGVLAEHGPRPTQQSVAVKVQDIPTDEEEQANLLGELAMLRAMKHHRVVSFIGAAIAGQQVMVVMELCSNRALREALALHLSWELKMRMALDVAEGMVYIHSRNIIHRDLKTPNVLITEQWRAKICDFNFAVDVDSAAKMEFCAGTEEFMCPEMMLSQDYDTRADVFSFGIILVEMATGIRPSINFPTRLPQAPHYFMIEPAEVQAAVLPACPPSLVALTLQCLDSEPSDRIQSDEAQLWLDELLQDTCSRLGLGGPDEIPSPPTGPPLPLLNDSSACLREGTLVQQLSLEGGGRSGQPNKPSPTDGAYDFPMGSDVRAWLESYVNSSMDKRVSNVQLHNLELKVQMLEEELQDKEATLHRLDRECVHQVQLQLLADQLQQAENRVTVLEALVEQQQILILRNDGMMNTISDAIEFSHGQFEGLHQRFLSATIGHESVPATLALGGSLRSAQSGRPGGHTAPADCPVAAGPTPPLGVHRADSAGDHPVLGGGSYGLVSPRQADQFEQIWHSTPEADHSLPMEHLKRVQSRRRFGKGTGVGTAVATHPHHHTSPAGAR